MAILAEPCTDGDHIDPRVRANVQKPKLTARNQSEPPPTPAEKERIPPLLASVDWEAKQAQTDEEGNEIIKIEVPDEYGDWDDWDHDNTILTEQAIADLHGLKFWQRGPVGPLEGGPVTWKGIPWNADKQCWGWTSRDQLPPQYAFDDWWSDESMKEELALTLRLHIPWNLRGPPDGPDEARGLYTWGSRKWRPNTKMWMNAGGKKKEQRDARFSKGKGKGRGKLKSDSVGKGGGSSGGKGGGSSGGKGRGRRNRGKAK